MANLSAIKLPNGTTYNLKDNGALQLTGGSVTGPVSFGDSVSIDEATVGDLVVNGSASFTNNLQANTINGVAVGSSPKFTDTTYSSLAAASGGTAVSLVTTGEKYTWNSKTSNTGTVTSVAISNGGGLSVSGSPITSSGTITISHADTSSQASSSNSGRTYIQSLTLDAYGHVTKISTATETVTDTNTHRPIQMNGTEILGNNTTALNLKAGTNVSLSNSSGTVTISATDTTYESKAAASGGTAVSLVTTGEKYTWNSKTSNTGTITSVKTTAGTHTTINVSSGAVSFNVPTKTSHLTNDSGFITNAGVTGVKGNAESSYRTGQVNLTPANLGAVRGNSYLFYGTCNTEAATAEKTVACNDFTSNDLQPGAVINVYFTVTNSAAVANLQLNVNGTGAKPIRYIYNGSYSNIPGAGYIKLNQVYQFTYDGTYWIVQMIYNTDADWRVRADYGRFTAGVGGLLPYALVMKASDGRWESITTTSTTAKTKVKNTTGFLLDAIFFRNVNNTVAEGNVDSNWQMNSSNLCDARYHLNIENTEALKLNVGNSLYLVGTIGSDGLFYLDDTWWAQDLPTTANGKCYVYLGTIFDWYRYNLDVFHPIYKFVNGKIRNISFDAVLINGHTVNSDVPANAKFTDTVPTATQSKVTGITASTTATKTTLGTAFTIPNVTSAGSASTWAFEEVSIPNVTSAGSASTWAFEEISIPNVTAAGSASTWTFGATTVGDGTLVGTVDSSDTSMLVITAGTKSVQQKTGGGNGTAPTIGTAIKVQSKKSGANSTAPTLGTAIKVQSKKSGANGSAPTLGTAFTVPNVTGNTSATVSVTDPGHTHSI